MIYMLVPIKEYLLKKRAELGNKSIAGLIEEIQTDMCRSLHEDYGGDWKFSRYEGAYSIFVDAANDRGLRVLTPTI